jgi:hypothetical protein
MAYAVVEKLLSSDVAHDECSRSRSSLLAMDTRSTVGRGRSGAKGTRCIRWMSACQSFGTTRVDSQGLDL